jgi:filamentous hemagglutinin
MITFMNRARGSSVSGKAVNLEADNQVALLAAANTTTQTSSSSNRSASVGLAAQLGNSGGGIGFTGSVSRGKGSGNGTETTYTNTQVTGADSVTIKSGGDTTLKGATVEGKQVTATVGGNLNVQSLQDTATYAEKSQQVGGAITSTQAAIDDNKNTFTTGGNLTTSDIQNKADYKATSVSVSVSAGNSPLPGQGLSSTLSGAGLGKDSGNANSTTTAGISGLAGDTAKRTGDNAQGISKIFDAEKVRQEITAQATITQEFGKQASTTVQSYAQTQRKELQDQIKTASDADKATLQKQLDDVNTQERVLNVLVGAVSGLGASAMTKETLAAAADEMRALMIKDSSTFAGVVDGTGKTLSNNSGTSDGIKGDGVKLGGTRVDLDLLCGQGNARCSFETKPDGSIDTSKPVTFKGPDVTKPDGTVGSQTLDEFLATDAGKEMRGLTGGVQGYKGTLFGTPYEKGSWQDKLIESFAGTHDMIGGRLTGLYDSQGNIKQGMSDAERAVYNYGVTTTAILPSIPFAAAQGLSPEVWNAISILLKAAR